MHQTLSALVAPVFAAVDAAAASLLVYDEAVIVTHTPEQHVVEVGVRADAFREQSLFDLASVISYNCINNDSNRDKTQNL